VTGPVLHQVEAALPAALPEKIGVAVSGGGDCMALLVVLHDLLTPRGHGLSVVTVDHRLRPEAAGEARAVAALCASMRLPHRTLVWENRNDGGNLQAAARAARHRLITDWALAEGIGAIALGHTLDDQAETVVMRLARSAGVDGLSAMSSVTRRQGMLWLRPLLGLRRDALRDVLRARGIPWQEDPSNEDESFERVRVRQALDLLAPLGVTPEALARVAENMHRARDALDHQTRTAARELASVRGGALRIDRVGFDALPGEIARRLLIAALQWIRGAGYDPRGRSLDAARAALARKGSATLEGCRLLAWKDGLWIVREHAAVRSLRCPVGHIWDGRWRIDGPGRAGLVVAALGAEGLRRCPGWRDTGLPRAALLSAPAIWDGADLVAAPLAGLPNGWAATPAKPDSCFFDAAFAH
jgi:tRNA(Ile)-lysidine synthase